MGQFVIKKRTWKKLCERCTLEYEAKAPNQKKCDDCKRYDPKRTPGF